jgi:hypothetical protein
MKEHYNRFKEAPWFLSTTEEEKAMIPYSTIFIGGAGGIGSWTALFLSRAGFYTYVQDFDRIETHNLGGQCFRTQDIGIFKVNALQDLIYDFTGSQMCSVSTETVEKDTPGYPFMVSAFDNMEARKMFFEAWKKSLINDGLEYKDALFIDGRLSMEGYEIYCVTPDKIKEYEETLFLDEEVEDLPCTMKQTTHVAAMIGSQITALFTNHVTNIKAGKAIRSVPFKYTFFTPLFCN